MRRMGRWIALTVCGLVLSACGGMAAQHNDVLIFGTDTKLALDVSTSAASGGSPEVTIGYKRQEAVWMPLVVNGRGVSGAPLQTLCVKPNAADASKYDLATCDANATPADWACLNSTTNGYAPCAGAPLPRQQICGDDKASRTLCSFDVDTRKYVGSAEPRDGKPGGTDAYSVFASFGADITGNGTGGKVGLAQFFATGIAAQRLAANSQVASALSVQPPETGVAMAAASAAQSPEVLAAIEAGTKQAGLNKSNAGFLAACAALKAPTKLSTIAPPNPVNPDPAGLYPGFLKALEGAKTEGDFSRVIAVFRPSFSQEIASTITNCGGTPV